MFKIFAVKVKMTCFFSALPLDVAMFVQAQVINEWTARLSRLMISFLITVAMFKEK